MSRFLEEYREKLLEARKEISDLVTMLAKRDAEIKELERRIAAARHYALSYRDSYLVDICDGVKGAER